jgi:hypothetical protein
MTERLPKSVLVTAVLLLFLAAAYVAFSRPSYFTNSRMLAGLLLLEVLCAGLWLYRRFFFPLVLTSFLLAGTLLPLSGGVWTVARWFVLCAGALAGCFIMLKERSSRLGLFHAVALFAVAAGGVSAAVSRYPRFALLKAASLALLFVYAGTGARLAIAGREKRFMSGLVTGTELFVAVVGAFYITGSEVMGNPNSLGAVMGVVAVPVLLWGIMVPESALVHYRRLALGALATYLLFQSHSRAAMAAAFLSCAVLCLTLRRYKLFSQGMVLVLIFAASAGIFFPEKFSTRVSSVTSSILYKERDASLGIFASRESPWERAMDSIHKHFWFGSGFGTTDNGLDASAHLRTFATTGDASVENGSSYLAILTWVGMLGVLPFALLVGVLTWKVLCTCAWMRSTVGAEHPAIPLAMIVLAGLVHAGFEDWLFAPGYYLCVFFWSVAFILVDVVPWTPMSNFSRSGLPIAWAARSGSSCGPVHAPIH